jgi:hypothetical protein
VSVTSEVHVLTTSIIASTMPTNIEKDRHYQKY